MCLFFRLFVLAFACLFVCLFVCLFLLSFVCLFVPAFDCLFACLSIYLFEFINLLVWLLACLLLLLFGWGWSKRHNWIAQRFGNMAARWSLNAKSSAPHPRTRPNSQEVPSNDSRNHQRRGHLVITHSRNPSLFKTPNQHEKVALDGIIYISYIYIFHYIYILEHLSLSLGSEISGSKQSHDSQCCQMSGLKSASSSCYKNPNSAAPGLCWTNPVIFISYTLYNLQLWQMVVDCICTMRLRTFWGLPKANALSQMSVTPCLGTPTGNHIRFQSSSEPCWSEGETIANNKQY